MKRITVFLLLLFTAIINGQEKSILKAPETNQRVELLSISFRLAGSEEYSAEIFKMYTDRIKEHYAGYQDHELIRFIKKLRKENGVSYDAVMKMAVHLDENLDPKVKFTNEIPDPRWGQENALEFVRLLKQFYKDSNSEAFFDQNRELYAAASKRFQPVYEKLDTKWYKDFYGKEPTEEFIIINGLGNGGGNFGASVTLPDGRKEVYAIMGAWNTDEEGMVRFPVKSYFPTLLHEFNHSFVNEIMDRNMEKFENSAEEIYEAVENQMRDGAYGNWQTMINEAMVRAAVIKYMNDHRFPENEISLETSEQLNRGFIWIEDLVEELEYYDDHRETYPVLENFIPVMASSYENYAANIQAYMAAAKKANPRLVSITEFENGSKEVDPSLKHISLNFDRPFTGSNFISPGDNMESFPEFTDLRFSEDRKTVILQWTLKKDRDYEFYLNGISRISEDPKENEDYHISFRTK